jgi:hypothetical protein
MDTNSQETMRARDPADQAIERAHEEAKARGMAIEENQIAAALANGELRSPNASPGDINAESSENITRSVGEVIDMRFRGYGSGYGIYEYDTLTTTVQYIGPNTIYLEDTSNPSYPSFTNAEYVDLDATFGNTTLPTLKEYIGETVDVNGLGVDDHGRFTILITKKVNGSGALGFVSSLDMYDPSDHPGLGSNFAEIFYALAPDPGGIYGSAKSKDTVLSKYPGLLAHEVTHILHNVQSHYAGGESLESWEKEGVATMMEWVVGNKVLGHGGAGQNIGVTDYDEGYFANWYHDLWNDGSRYFGSGSSASVAPHECSWLSAVSTSCNDSRAKYRSAILFRYLLDRYGPSYPGGEAALMRAMSKSDYTGYANLVNATGASSIGLLLTLFGTNLYTDGRSGVTQNSTTAGITYWDYTPIMKSGGGTAIIPLASASASASATLNVRAGSTHYYEWSPTLTHAPTAFKWTDSSGGTLPSTVGRWIFRVR